METEAELNKKEAQKTDDGYSEERLALKFDQGAPSKQTMKGGNVFAPQKPVVQQTVFQAQKSDKK
jgi:hypothetical protein